MKTQRKENISGECEARRDERGGGRERGAGSRQGL